MWALSCELSKWLEDIHSQGVITEFPHSITSDLGGLDLS